MKVEFSYPENEVRGLIQYNEKSKEVTVTFLDPQKKTEIENCLTTNQTFVQPVKPPKAMGQVTDYCDLVKGKPISNPLLFQEAMSMLWGHTDCFVHWETTGRGDV